MSGRAKAARIEVRDSAVHGRGVFALEPIGKGDRVVEYVGERVPAEEGYARYNESVPYHTFLFDLDNGQAIDAGVGGNESAFLNHSCAPNVEAQVRAGRVFIRATRAIAAGRELLLDYAFEPDDADNPAVRAEYPCRCGARRCRGTMVRAS